MRPYLRSYDSHLASGNRTRRLCDGTLVVTPRQINNPAIKGQHKDAAVRSNHFLATDYSATWISSHKPALAKWEDAMDSDICYDIVGERVDPGDIRNPIYKERRSWAINNQPITSHELPFNFLNVDSFRTTSGSADFSNGARKVKDEMTNEFLNKIKDQKAMSLVTIAESAKTVSLVRSLSKDVSDAILFVAKGIYSPKTVIDSFISYTRRNGLRRPERASNLKSHDKRFIRNMQRYYKNRPQQMRKMLSKTADTAAERWLQYRYGIGPLMGDFSAAHDYVYTKWHEFIHSNHIVTKYKVTRETKVRANLPYDGVLVKGDSVAKCQYIGRYFIANQVARHTQKVGFSPTELLATAWELIPFSFVVDWAYNLGDYFSALSATVGLRHVQTSFSVKESCKVDSKCILGMQYAGRETPAGPDGNIEYGAFVRRTYGYFPLPVLPSIKFPFDSFIDKRIFDSVALLLGGFNSKQLSNRGA